MATEKEFYELIGRVVADSAFRDKVVQDPEAAAQTLGFELTTDQLDKLKRADLATLSTELESRASKRLA